MEDTALTDPLPLSDGTLLEVRRLNRADAAALQAFNAALTTETRRLFNPHPYDEDTLLRLLQRSEDGEDLTLGVFDGEALVGYFFLWYFRRRVPLLGIGLRDAFQGRGLGGRMIERLISAAAARGCEGVELTTLPDNQRAFALYNRCGFKHYADVPNRSGDGRILTERGMFYAIRPGAAPMTGPHQPPL